MAKLGLTGTTLVFWSYLGGTNAELATGIAVERTGAAYVTGQTFSDNFLLANPLQAAPVGNYDAYIAKVSALAGTSFLYTNQMEARYQIPRSLFLADYSLFVIIPR